jgi:hypothetical protein
MQNRVPVHVDFAKIAAYFALENTACGNRRSPSGLPNKPEAAGMLD